MSKMSFIAKICAILAFFLLLIFTRGTPFIEDPWLITIVGIFLGILISSCYDDGRKYKEARQGWMTGNWLLTIHDSTASRQDLYFVTHRENNISADVLRVSPDKEGEIGRKWKFSGRLIDNTKLIGHYWSQEKGSSSCGAQFLLKPEKGENNLTYNGNYFEGTYVKSNVTKLGQKADDVLIPSTKITWKKLSNLDQYQSILQRHQTSRWPKVILPFNSKKQRDRGIGVKK